MKSYHSPLTLTARILALVADISEQVGVLAANHEAVLTPQLKRSNRTRTIQASLAIENNTLDIDQVTAVLEGKRVLGLPREIQEVRNAFSAYEAMPGWAPTQLNDLLGAHRLLMHGLIDDAGQLRSSGVGIYRGQRLLHMAPPASRLIPLMHDLLQWQTVILSQWRPVLAYLPVESVICARQEA